jgi:hypothetical protein
VRVLKYRREPTDEVELYWRLADDLTLQASRALYLFRNQRGREILYIGKAYHQTIREPLVLSLEGEIGETGTGGRDRGYVFDHWFPYDQMRDPGTRR